MILTHVGCPCKTHTNHHYYNRGFYKIKEHAYKHKNKIYQRIKRHNTQTYHDPNVNLDTAFEMSASNIRYGPGITREVGYDFKEMKVKLVGVFADPNLVDRKDDSAVNVALQSLVQAGVKFKVFSDIGIEPTDKSFKKAIKWAQSHDFDAYLAVGGGSTMDTAKAANLYASYPPEDFLDYVNPPIGKGKPPPGLVKPFIAIPTTAGTGSETTGVSIFDYEEIHAKTGIAHRILRPLLGIVDPLNTRTLPSNVSAFSGFDVLCHALESFTAMPFNKRPRPERPILRPAYQGSNPISDYWSLIALEMTSKYIERAYRDPTDHEARAQMLLASTYAGIGFGNAGVHLCHGMSYPVSGMAHLVKYFPKDYGTTKSIIPHGMSVIMHAPAVFKFTVSSDPGRHKIAALKMGANVDSIKDEDVGTILVDEIVKLMKALNIPNGLSALGFNDKHINALVEGTIPQHRVTKLSPRHVGRPELHQLFKDSMKVY